MNWTQIYNRWIRKAHISAGDYPTAVADEDIDIIYQELVDLIVNVSKWDYFWDSWIANTITGQSEYSADKLGISPNDLDIKKINKVFFKYDANDEYFTQVKYQNPWTLEKHPDYYKTNQPKNQPFFYVQDKSIFIYPAPDVDVANWLELYVIHKPAAITTATIEEDIELNTQFHYLLSFWLALSALQDARRTWEPLYAEIKNEFELWKRDMVNFIKERYNQPKERTLSWLNNFR